MPDDFICMGKVPQQMDKQNYPKISHVDPLNCKLLLQGMITTLVKERGKGPSNINSGEPSGDQLAFYSLTLVKAWFNCSCYYLSHATPGGLCTENCQGWEFY